MIRREDSYGLRKGREACRPAPHSDPRQIRRTEALALKFFAAAYAELGLRTEALLMAAAYAALMDSNGESVFFAPDSSDP